MSVSEDFGANWFGDYFRRNVQRFPSWILQAGFTVAPSTMLLRGRDGHTSRSLDIHPLILY